MTSISKDMCIDKLNKTANKFNNTCHSKLKRKPVYVKSNINIHFGKKNDREDPKFKVYDHVRILKYKKQFCNRLGSKGVSTFFSFFQDLILLFYLLFATNYIS